VAERGLSCGQGWSVPTGSQLVTSGERWVERVLSASEKGLGEGGLGSKLVQCAKRPLTRHERTRSQKERGWLVATERVFVVPPGKCDVPNVGKVRLQRSGGKRQTPEVGATEKKKGYNTNRSSRRENRTLSEHRFQAILRESAKGTAERDNHR